MSSVFLRGIFSFSTPSKPSHYTTTFLTVNFVLSSEYTAQNCSYSHCLKRKDNPCINKFTYLIDMCMYRARVIE